jgi:tetratricopeptide (TPR) repeat protein
MTARLWIFAGVMVVGLLCGGGRLQAQPASEPGPVGDAPSPAGDAPVQPGDAPAQLGRGSSEVDDDPLVNDDPEKPWVRGVPMEDREAARVIFRNGYRLAEELKAYRSAAEKFTAALAMWRHPSFYFNLGLAQFYLGQEVEARENLERALEYGEEPLGTEFFQEAQKRLQEVKRQLGRIRVTCRTPGASVTLDGSTLFIGPGSHEGWMKAKAYEVTAKKPGYQSEARRVIVPAGEFLEVDLSLVTLTQAADISRRWASWKPWAVVASGIAVMGGGSVAHAFAFRNLKAFDEEVLALDCAPDGCEEDEVDHDQFRRARRQQVFAVGSYAVGGSLIITGAVLLYWNRPRLMEQGGSPAFLGRMAIVPTISGDMLGVSVGVRH